MSRGRRSGGRVKRRPITEEERAQAVQEYQEAVGRFQQSAFRNLRTSMANITIFFAFVSAFVISIGEAAPATIAPMVISIVGGALGLSTYFVRQQPLARYLLVSAVVLGVVGLAGTVIMSQVANS